MSARASRCWGRRPPARARWPSCLAERLGGEIINCDSTAVYRGFDIGTDKVPVAERRGIPHHLIDIVEPTDADYTAADFARDAAARSCATFTARGRVPILGGRHGLLLPCADARAVSRARGGTRRCARGWMPSLARSAWHRLLHRAGRRGRSGVGRAHSVARPEAARARAGGVLPDRAAADGAFRGDGSPLPDGVVVLALAPAAAGRLIAERVPGGWTSSSRAGCWMRFADHARGRGARDGASVRRAGLSAGPRAPARRARRAGHPRADCAGEPPICPSAVDLVPQRA